MLTKIVTVVQALAVVAAAVFVVFLFAGGDSDSDSGGSDAAVDAPGADIYSAACAGCHGADGAGSVGPALADGAMVATYPDIEDQIAVITQGQGGMPSFEGRLTPEEIADVATYTRESL